MWLTWGWGCGGLSALPQDGAGTDVSAVTDRPTDTGASPEPEPSPPTTSSTAPHTGLPVEADYGAAAWIPGPPPGDRAEASAILPLFGAFSGPVKWASNNPEAFDGPGWLMLNSRTDAARGGARLPVDDAVAYLYHLNRASQTQWVHLIATNPNATDATVSARGRILTNQQHPLLGAGTGPSYRVAEAWLLDDLDETGGTIAFGRGVELARAELPPLAMVDGRFHVTADQGVFLYTVVTATGALNDAINASQGAPAAGEIAVSGPNTYGREAGVYAASGWTGAASFALPPADGWLAFCFNTNQKFAWDGVVQQDLTADAQMTLVDASPETWGNYGHRYDLTFSVTNPTGRPRTVTLQLASQYTAAQDVPSFTWNAPMLVDGDLVTAFTTPTDPGARLATRVLQPGETVEITLETYVPGLITSGQHLILSAED